MAEEKREKYDQIKSILREMMSFHLIRTEMDATFVYTSRVVHLGSKSFTIVSPVRGEVATELRSGEKVRFSYIGSDAIYQFDTEVIDRKTENNQLYYLLKFPKTGWRLQRRNFFRVKVNLKAKYREMKESVSGNEHQLTAKTMWEDCVVDDLSAGGVLLSANEFLDLQTYVEIQFELPLEDKPVSYEEIVKIVRSDTAKQGNSFDGYQYRYGGYFFTMEDKNRIGLTRFLYERQLEKGKPAP